MQVSKKSAPDSDLSVLVLCHDEGFKTHKTLLNIFEQLKSADIDAEVILSLDSPSKETEDYIKTNNTLFDEHNVQILRSSFSDEGNARNECLEAASGRYVFFIRAGNLISKTYIKNALTTLRTKKAAAVHCTTVVKFYDKAFSPSTICKAPPLSGGISGIITSLLDSPLASSLIYEKSLLEKFSFFSAGKGYEKLDWQLVCALLNAGTKFYGIEETCLYVRAKKPMGPEDNHSVIPANPIHSPSAMNALSMPDEFTPILRRLGLIESKGLKGKIANFISSYPTLNHILRSTIHRVRNFKNFNKPRRLGFRKKAHQGSRDWLVEDSHHIHNIEPKVYLYSSQEQHTNRTVGYDSDISYAAGIAYKVGCQYLHHNNYDYILIVPWLITGGADMFFINYANSVAAARKDKHVLIIATHEASKSLSKESLRISDMVDFLPLPELIRSSDSYKSICQIVLSTLIENLKPSVLHIANSLMGYIYVEQHFTYLSAHKIKIIATGYNEVINAHGQRLGYVHEFIPNCYPQLSLITTDNQSMIDMWANEYGFSRSNMVLHHQPFKPAPYHKQIGDYKDNVVRVLWASHVRKEKRPETAVQVARLLARDKRFSIDCYGAVDKGHYPLSPFIGGSFSGLHYKGGYKNFFQDINLREYDLFLYTSMFDGTPNILIEAGLAKLPIVSSAIGGIPELLGSDATLIDDPTNPRLFAAALKQFAKDKTEFLKKADRLEARLSETQTYDYFMTEIESMLRKVDY